MGYRRMTRRDLWEIYRRWRAGQSVSRIVVSEQRDRKTVRAYVLEFSKLGLDAESAPLERQRFYELVQQLLQGMNRRAAPATDELLEHRDELSQLINRKKDPLKPKTAFEVLKIKHELLGSYETFKRVTRSEGLSRPERRRMIRIELPRRGWRPSSITGASERWQTNVMAPIGWCGVLWDPGAQSPAVRAVRVDSGPAELCIQLRLDVALLRRHHRIRLPGQPEVWRREARPFGPPNQPLFEAFPP